MLFLASRDNSIRIWDSRSEKCENLIQGAHVNNAGGTSTPKRSKSNFGFTSGSVTAICFQDSHHLISCGDTDGIVKLWDTRMSYSLYNKAPRPKFEFHHPGNTSMQGFISLAMNVNSRFVYASCMDNSIYQFDAIICDKKPSKRFVGLESSFYQHISLSGDGKLLASGSKDKNAYIWNVESTTSEEPLMVLEGHGEEVTCVDWCNDSSVLCRLATASDDQRHRIWELDRTPISDENKNQLRGRCVVKNAERNELRLSNSIWSPLPNSSNNEEKFWLKKLSDHKLPQLSVMNGTLQSPKKSSAFSKDLPCSPKKLCISPKKNFSPRKLSFQSSPKKTILALRNLPNLVRDRRQNVNQTSSPKPLKRPMPETWLDKLRREKLRDLKENNEASPATPSPKRKRRKLK